MLSDLEPNRAITLLRKAIDQSADPQPAALLALGTALLTRGNIDDAMNEYHKAITTGKQQRKKTWSLLAECKSFGSDNKLQSNCEASLEEPNQVDRICVY
jgi:tetratricopeptide (TPR) repeat protein